MTKRRRVDASKLIEAVESGRLKKDIMDLYGVEAPSKKSKVSGLRRRRGRQSDGTLDVGFFPNVELRITKRGSLVLPRSLIEELGYEQGDEFIARKTKVGISLRKTD